MRSLKTIAIIGATGRMGRAISKKLVAGKYRLLLMANDRGKLTALKEELVHAGEKVEVELSSCAMEASWEADIILMATPYKAEKEVAEKIRQVATGKIVISISSPLDGDFNDLITPTDTSAGEELQKMLPYSKVVKTFNATLSADFEPPVMGGERVDAFVAGNSRDAVDTVSAIVKTAGFNPVFAGDLAISRTLERMQLMLIQIGIRNNFSGLAGWKIFHK